jgi:putative ABC transport system permease protein
MEVGPGQWLPLLLFVVPDFSAQRISLVNLEHGRWPDRAGEIVIERTAMTLAKASVGRGLNVQTPDGPAREVVVAGIVHDASLAPAPQQQVGYGYITEATLKMLGENIASHSLRVTAIPGRNVEQVIVAVAQWLKRSGYSVGEIRIPPRHHPHWGVMSNIVRMLLAFSVLTLILSALLSATLTSSLLAPQVRQIGIMKAIGARTSQIMGLYASLIAAIGLLAVTIGLPAGLYAGRALATFVARNQNIDLSNVSIPAWVYLAIAASGCVIPLLFAFIPITIATRRTVRECLFYFGVTTPATKPGRWTASLFHRSPILTFSIRNSVRRRLRLARPIGFLAAAGALFVASMNILAGWKQSLSAAEAERHYDIEIEFKEAQSVADVRATVSGIAGVRTVEAFDHAPAAIVRSDGLDITQTFPDGEHGRLGVNAIPADSTFVTPHLIAGQWLGSTNPSGAVLNEQALAFFPSAKVGDLLDLTARGRAAQLRMAGIIREHLAGASIYTRSEDFAQKFGQLGFTHGLRIGLADQREESEVKAMATVEHSLEASGVKVVGSTSRSAMGRGLAGHLFILIFILFVMSILMALVGVFGLGTALATSVLERRRELAIMRTIGASDNQVHFAVIGEGVFIGLLSAIAAAGLSIPVTALIGSFVGRTLLGPWQDIVVSSAAIPIWILAVVVCAISASAYPARTATRLTVREALIDQ